jgi:hypothetical protein
MASAAANTDLPARTAHHMSGRLPGKPAYLWLWYADGGVAPVDSQYCGDIVPPAFKCNYGSGIDGSRIDDCRQQVQALLDAWYKDFNLLFTFTRPPSGDFYTVIITSGWSKCQQTLPPSESGMDPSKEAGIAPGNGCIDNPGQTALAIECGFNAHDCATLIAHEHAHLVGLEHTASRTDVLYSTILASATGFDNSSSNVVDDACDLKTQNSYQQMLAALGAWPGGTKPSPLSALPDAGAPDLPRIDNPDASTGGGSVGPTPVGGSGDGGITVVPGFDAPDIVRPIIPTVDAANQTSNKSGGCNLAGAADSASASTGILLLLLALFARRSVLRWNLRGSAARTRGTSARRP